MLVGAKTQCNIKGIVCVRACNKTHLSLMHHSYSYFIVLKWCPVAARILSVFISNRSLLRSTPGHISPELLGMARTKQSAQRYQTTLAAILLAECQTR